MSQFQGTWTDDESVPRTNFEELMKKLEIQADLIEKYKNSKTTMTYTVNGNKVEVKVASTAFPGQTREYSFTSGEPFDDVGMDGSTFKATVTLDSDSKLTESGSSEKWGQFCCTREIVGNVMKVNQTNAGITMTYQMKRA